MSKAIRSSNEERARKTLPKSRVLSNVLEWHFKGGDHTNPTMTIGGHCGTTTMNTGPVMATSFVINCTK